MQRFHAQLHAIRLLAQGVHEFEFRPTNGETWPAASAGAHIDIVLPNGTVRSYSLTNPPGETHRYVCAVALDSTGRGGSKYMHQSLRIGDHVDISIPRNAFPLNEAAEKSVFVAGGIGITPLWSMIQRLTAIGKPWVLYYSTKSPEIAAYTADIAKLASESGNCVNFNFDGGQKEKMLDLRALSASCAEDTHLYCCGPAPMLKAFESACDGRNPETVHREYFAAPAPAPSSPGEADGRSAFRVVLSRSNTILNVDESRSILDAVLDAGVDVPFSCMNGVCRSCETRVIGGMPDHRDLVLTDAERESGATMIICCSRAKSEELILDL